MPAVPPTRREYSSFQKAYDFFNRRLFDDSLPQVIITLQRRAKAGGYFSGRRFRHRRGEEATDELALNPDYFGGRTDEQILSILVHEMAHVWQQARGKPGRGRYHNREWARKMKDLGLHPSSTSAPGGAETGQRVGHYVVDGGPFQKQCRRLLAGGFELRWQSVPFGTGPGGGGPVDLSKVKHTCPACGQNAWAKLRAVLLCGACASGETAPSGVNADSPLTLRGWAVLMLPQV